MESFRAELLKRLQKGLGDYEFLKESRQTSLAGMASDSEDSADLHAYENALSFWDEKLLQEGSRLARVVGEFLSESSQEGKK